jgi:hypothetical protein
VISNLQPPFYFELIGLEENGRKAHIRAGAARALPSGVKAAVKALGAAQEFRVKN